MTNRLDRVPLRAFAVCAATVLAACPAPRAPRAPPPRTTVPDASTRWTGAENVQPPVVRAWPVMGAVLQVSVWDADTARALAAMDRARAAVLRVDSLMSVSQAGSEVAAANRRAGTDSATTLSPWTAEVVDSALALSTASGGAIDATVGALLDAWGFYRRQGAVPTPAAADSVARLVDWRRVRFDRPSRRISLPTRGMRLDLGGIARGFAVDKGVEALRAAGIGRAVVDLGGRYAVLGTPPVGPKWSVALKNPFEPDEVFAAVQMDGGAVGTAAGYEDFFEAGGVRYAPFFDPRTRRPTHGVASVSVIAPSALLADALSTPLFVLGPEDGCLLAARYPGVDAVWVRDPGEDAEEEERDADDGVDPHLVVITDGLADRLELLSEEPTEERAIRCSELVNPHQRSPGFPKSVPPGGSGGATPAPLLPFAPSSVLRPSPL